jgi:hypothetical protein
LKNLTKIEYLNPRQDAISVIAFGPKPEGGIQKDVVKMMVIILELSSNSVVQYS